MASFLAALRRRPPADTSVPGSLCLSSPVSVRHLCARFAAAGSDFSAATTDYSQRGGFIEPISALHVRAVALIRVNGRMESSAVGARSPAPRAACLRCGPSGRWPRAPRSCAVRNARSRVVATPPVKPAAKTRSEPLFTAEPDDLGGNHGHQKQNEYQKSQRILGARNTTDVDAEEACQRSER